MGKWTAYVLLTKIVPNNFQIKRFALTLTIRNMVNIETSKIY